MAELEVRSLDEPDETRPFVDKGQVGIVKLSGGTVGLGTFEPGWRWSEHVKPLAGTESCQAAHMGYCISGRSPSEARGRCFSCGTSHCGPARS